MNWIDLFIKRPVLTWMLTLSLCVFGVLGFVRLGVNQFPDMEFPYVSVSARLDGAPPEVMEEDVTDVLESYLNTIEGVRRLESQSRQSNSNIGVEFELGTDLDRAAQDARDSVARAREELSPDVDPPIVRKLDFSGFPVLWAPLNTTRPQVEASEFVREFVKPRVETISGVGGIEIFGRLDRAIRIWLDGDALRARSLAATDVMAALRREHIERPGGFVEGANVEYVVRTDAEYQSVEELADMVIAYENGAPVRLRDVARVEDGAEDQRSYIRYDGAPAVGLGVSKQSDGNAVAIVDEFRERIRRLEPLMPPDIRFKQGEGVADFSLAIREAVREAIFALIFGALLATATVLVFLRRFRPTLVVALAIPLSIITTFGVMWLLGHTLNTMTILGLTLAVGVVIDDSIVVLENIERHRAQGEPPAAAASKGAREIAFAATAATVAIAVVFLPVIFTEGIVGNFLSEFGAAVAAAVMISLVVALTLTPMLAARIPSPRTPAEGGIYQRLGAAIARTENGYRRLLGWTLAHRGLTIAAATLCFGAGVAIAGQLGGELFPPADEGSITARIETQPGSSPEGTLSIMKSNEDWFLAQPEVAGVFVGAGYSGGGRNDPTRGIMFIILKRERERSAHEIIAAAREALEAVPGQRIRFGDMSGFGSDGAQFEVELQGNAELSELGQLADRVIAAMRDSGGFVDFDKSLKLGKPELRVIPDRERAAALGVNADQLATTVRAMIGGLDVGTYKESGNRYDIRLRLEEADRTDPESILGLYARTRDGGVVELRNLVRLEKTAAPSTITRVDRQRSVNISANLQGRDSRNALAAVRSAAADILPEEVRLVASGELREMESGFGELFFAMGLAILVIYMVLAAQFESWVHPFTVMLALPLAWVGAVGGLWLMGMTLNLFSMIGIILLFGLVTKNSILLVDYTNQLRQRGMDKVEAVKTAAPVRMRPVLMTALSMIFGVAPAAFGIGPGSESRAPMAVAAGAGMISSTALTLLVVPVFYLVLDDGVAWLKRKVLRIPTAAREQAAA